MSLADPIEPNPQAAPTPTKPEWLVGSDEGARAEAETGPSTRRGDAGRRPEASPHAPTERPRLELVPPRDAAKTASSSPEVSPGVAPEPPSAPEASAEDSAGKGAWKAAASSVPRLRQQPAASAQPAEAEAFQGFAQDTVMTKGATIGGGPGGTASDPVGEGANEDTMPLAEDPPFWVQWIEQLRALPRPVMIGAVVALALGAAAWMFYPRGTPGVSLAQIRQRPEAFEGRSVHVNGRAGEAFSVGESYVFDLVQGRDTIVVYSRTSPPQLHQKVGVDGTVSIGYLDGVPRVAVLENP
jgi:hypothetical protein